MHLGCLYEACSSAWLGAAGLQAFSHIGKHNRASDTKQACRATAATFSVVRPMRRTLAWVAWAAAAAGWAAAATVTRYCCCCWSARYACR